MQKQFVSVEAKPEGFGLMGLPNNRQSIPLVCQNVAELGVPLPFAYESTGVECRFTNRKEPDARRQNKLQLPSTDELIRLVKLDKQVRGLLRDMPPMNTAIFGKCQIDSINNLENSLALNKPRALIQMARAVARPLLPSTSAIGLSSTLLLRRILILVTETIWGNKRSMNFSNSSVR